VTGEYVAEAFERIAADEGAGGATGGASIGDRIGGRIGAFVPKLRAHGRVYSPESSYLYQLRRQFRRQRHQLAVDAVGIQPRALNAYNSGALLRAEAMRAVGGFPAEFWLDFLDHAVFEELDRGGYRVFVMRAVLEHDLSHADPAAVPLWRRRNVLTAQTRFVLRYGGWRERAWFRVSLLRGAGRAFRESPHRVLWKEILLQALLLRLPSVRLGS
jgi:GT2 family glycosyltransferase